MKVHDFKTVGEFEEQESVLIIWPVNKYATQSKEFDIEAVSLELVQYLIDHVAVIISCYDDAQKEYVITTLENNRIDVGKIRFMIFPAELIFSRDFGAEILVNNQGERAVADFNFDTYGMYPNNHPVSKKLEEFDRVHAKFVTVENLIFTRLTSEGGNREFNGDGILMTIEDTEVNKRNKGWTKEQVEAEFKRVFNLSQIIWLPYATYDDEDMYSGPIPDENGDLTAYRSGSANGHIDEMCRFVNRNTILIADVTEEEALSNPIHAYNKERLDIAYLHLKGETDNHGDPFTIIKMPVPEPIYVNILEGDPVFDDYQQAHDMLHGKLRDGSPFPKEKMKVMPALSYCNFLITNNLVIAQKYYREGMPYKVKEKDEEALRILQSVFPERKVVAMATIALNLYGGGIHCYTRNVPKGHTP